MSNIFCAGCGKEMAEDAPTCPNCGKPNESAKKKLGVGMILGIIFIPFIFAWFTLKKGVSVTARVVSFIWMIVYIGAAGSSQDGGSSGNTARNTTTGAPTITSSGPNIVATLRAPQLVAEYDQNEVAADNKYKKKYVRVSGSIEDIGKDIMDDIYITLDGGGVDDMGLRSVQATFDDSYAETIAALSRGTKITLVCRVDGLMMNVQLDDCAIE